MRELEDTYLPYKPKKQSLASLARTRGLEPLATSILNATSATPSIEEQAVEFIDESKSLPDADAVFEGLKHLIAEHFGNHRELRAKLRNHLSKHGKLVSKKTDESQVENEQRPQTEAASEASPPKIESKPAPLSGTVSADPAETAPEPELPTIATNMPVVTEPPSGEAAATPANATAEEAAETATTQPINIGKHKNASNDATSRRDQRRETRRRRRERLVQSFKDYFDFSDPIGRIPHHRILAINRGERTKVLRVKIECFDWDKIQTEVESIAIPADDPHADFLKVCLQDAMSRLLVP